MHTMIAVTPMDTKKDVGSNLAMAHVAVTTDAEVQKDVQDAALLLSNEIFELIDSYRQPLPGDMPDLRSQGRALFTQVIYRRVVKGEKIPMVLPAFPFKSPNSQSKTLGVLPDKAEEIALQCLDGLCKNIERIYTPGAELFIVSDGIVYSDILGVSCKDVWNYGSGLRSFAEQRLDNIHFVRISTLTGSEEPLTAEEYEAQSPKLREKLIELYLPSDYNVQDQKANDNNVLATYRGYCKFLLLDLANNPEFAGLGKNAMKKKASILAEKMLVRGKAFAAAIRDNFTEHVRLSIHPSNGQDKVSISVIGQTTGLAMSPWHGTLLVSSDGSFSIRHRQELESDPKYELVYQNGRPSYFRERSDIYHWGNDQIDFEPAYPCGWYITAPESTGLTFDDVDMKKLRQLGELNSPVVLRGFKETNNRELFEKKAEEMGTVQSWIFGKVLEVQDGGSETGGLNNVLSAEAMPMHFDGLFNTKIITDEAGNEKRVSAYPRFQMFSSLVPAPKGTGKTLFASSRRLLQVLERNYTVDQLKAVTWECQTDAFNATVLREMPLWVPHPENQKLCVRYHEPWPKSRTKFDATEVRLNNAPADLGKRIDAGLYDSRVCNYLQFGENEIIVSDNVLMMHTREAYPPGSPRRFWRIHVN